MQKVATVSLRAAVKHARRQVQWHRHGKEWIVNTWDDNLGLWRAGNPENYFQANLHRRQLMFTAALEFLGQHHERANYLALGINGDWRAAVATWAREHRGRP